VRTRAIGNSPIASFLAGACALYVIGLFSDGEVPGPRHASAEAPDHPKLSFDLGKSPDGLVLPERREPPRLLREPGDEAPPGLEIAIEDLDGRSMTRFHEALQRASRGEGQARLVVYGASHTAADLFTGLLRDQLQQRYGDAGPGFVLPVHPWRRYRHNQLTIESNGDAWLTLKIGPAPNVLDHYGLAGVAMEASEVGAWGRVVTPTQGLGSQVSRFELFYLNQPHGGAFDVVIDDEVVRRIPTASEERASGYATFEVAEGPHRFELRVVEPGPVRIFGVALERDTPGVVVDTLGINGSRARAHLLWEENLYREHLQKRNPDLVVLAYGTNESGDEQPISEYEAELHQVLARIKSATPEASCLLIGPSDRPVPLGKNGKDGFSDRPRTTEIIEAQWRVALSHGCGFFDMVAFQGGPLSMVAWNQLDPPFAAPDHIHFRRRGYERFGEVLLGALLEGLPDGEPDGTGDADARHAKNR
jgi:lysophospholipase L1-like esterase